MRALIVGGTGNISWRLTEAALRENWQVTLLHRGTEGRRAVPPACTEIHCDIRDRVAVEAALSSLRFDAVIDFLCYNEQQAFDAIAAFGRRTGHYIFISTTALYERHGACLPLTEKTPISSGWDYAFAKAQAEKILLDFHNRTGFPVSVLRLAHTYDTIIPEAVGNGDWTNIWRVLNGKPIVIHGDGTTLWTVTHASDVASGIIAFIKANPDRGQVCHITTDEVHTWREITETVYDAFTAARPTICYRTTEEIDRISPRLGNGLKGHKMWCDHYDNTLFKSLCPGWQAEVPLVVGIQQTFRYFQARERLRQPNQQLDIVLDEICAIC